MNRLVTAAILAALALAVGAVGIEATTTAFAAIECVNGGGQNPQGNCQGANQAENPSGFAPPGQN